MKMRELEKLSQDESGRLYRANGVVLHPEFAFPEGKIKTLVIANPCLDISDEINKMVETNSAFIPKRANAYISSDFSGDTQHLRKANLEGQQKFYCVFAVQFYCIPSFSK
jgi:hypothetical protein